MRRAEVELKKKHEMAANKLSCLQQIQVRMATATKKKKKSKKVEGVKNTLRKLGN